MEEGEVVLAMAMADKADKIALNRVKVIRMDLRTSTRAMVMNLP